MRNRQLIEKIGNLNRELAVTRRQRDAGNAIANVMLRLLQTRRHRLVSFLFRLSADEKHFRGFASWIEDQKRSSVQPRTPAQRAAVDNET